MAELYNIDIEDIAKKTTKNAIDFIPFMIKRYTTYIYWWYNWNDSEK